MNADYWLLNAFISHADLSFVNIRSTILFTMGAFVLHVILSLLLFVFAIHWRPSVDCRMNVCICWIKWGLCPNCRESVVLGRSFLLRAWKKEFLSFRNIRIQTNLWPIRIRDDKAAPSAMMVESFFLFQGFFFIYSYNNTTGKTE